MGSSYVHVKSPSPRLRRIALGTGAVTLIGAMAVGLVLLLVASIRNSWDLIVFYAQRTDRPG